jgi:enoyl-CoA hydratase/carnithine racemase
MAYEQIIYEADNRIATITLNRPESLNTWTPVMMNEVLDALERADNDDNIRVVIFTGAGRAYCAGADLSAGGFRSPDELQGQPAFRDSAGQVTLRLFNMKKPVIGALNGNAVGVGITMTMAMDVRIASETVQKIGFVFNRRGVIPEGCCTFFLPRIIGISKACELILTGRLFSAREGLEMGLFSQVVPADDLMPTARKIAREIADNTSAVSTALARQLLWKMLGETEPMKTHILESKGFAYMLASDDVKEGVASFIEKRPPRFTMKPSTDMPDFYPWWEEPPFSNK